MPEMLFMIIPSNEPKQDSDTLDLEVVSVSCSKRNARGIANFLQKNMIDKDPYKCQDLYLT